METGGRGGGHMKFLLTNGVFAAKDKVYGFWTKDALRAKKEWKRERENSPWFIYPRISEEQKRL